MPKVKPVTTARVWSPFKLPSDITSENHSDMLVTKAITDNKSNKLA